MNKKYEGEYLRRAHVFSMNNLKKLQRDEGVCGCFSCCSIFYPYEINKFVMDKEETALCPYCYADAVIGAYSGFPITREFLEAMNEQWMQGIKEPCWELM